MKITAALVPIAAALMLSLPLAGPAQAFGGIPMVPQAIERHLEQQRLQEQIEQREREREAAEAARKDVAPAALLPEAPPVKAAKPVTPANKNAQTAKGIKKSPQPALAHSAQAAR